MSELLLEVLNTEPYEWESKRAANKRQFVFDQYRVEIMKDTSLGDNVAYVVLGKKHSGNTFRKIIGTIPNIFKVLSTIVHIIKEFLESSYGKTFDGLDIRLPTQAKKNHIRVIKKIVTRMLKPKFVPLDIDFSQDKDLHIWVIRKGKLPVSVFNGAAIPSDTFVGATEPVEPTEPAETIVPTVEPEREPESVAKPLETDDTSKKYNELRDKIYASYSGEEVKKVEEIVMGVNEGYNSIKSAQTDEEKMAAYTKFHNFYYKMTRNKIGNVITEVVPGVNFIDLWELAKESEKPWEYIEDVSKYDAHAIGEKLLNEINQSTPPVATIEPIKPAPVATIEPAKPKVSGQKLNTPAERSIALKKILGLSNIASPMNINESLFKTIGNVRFPSSTTVPIVNNFINKGEIPEAGVSGIAIHNFLSELLYGNKSFSVKRKKRNFKPTNNLTKPVLDYINNAIASPNPEVIVKDKLVFESIKKGGMSADHFDKTVSEMNALMGGNMPDIQFFRFTKKDDLYGKDDGSRAFAENFNGVYRINVGEAMTPDICWHEMGHIAELYNPRVRLAAYNELNRRYVAAPESKKVVYFNELEPTYFDDDEFGVNNYAADFYESKIYSKPLNEEGYLNPTSTELVSMGLQYIYPATNKLDALFTKHPDYLKFVLGVIKMMRDAK